MSVMDNWSSKTQEAMRTIRREIEDCKDWNELYGLEEALRTLSGEAEDKLMDMSDG